MLCKLRRCNYSLYSHSQRWNSSYLENKVAIVTGASSGMGRATAKLFYSHGAKVCAFDINESGLDSLKKEIKCKTFLVDVTNEEMVKQSMNNIYNEYGSLNILCNIAGVAPVTFAPLHLKEIDEIKHILNAHLLSTIICCKYAIINMLETLKFDTNLKGCSIVNMSSTTAASAHPGFLDYITAKHGIVGITKSLCAEYGASKIRCNAIQPGLIYTPMIDKMEKSTPGMTQAFENMVASGRGGTPQEVAELFLWFASDRSEYLNGAIVTMDDGLGSVRSFDPSHIPIAK